MVAPWLAGAGLQRLAWFGIPAMSPRYFARKIGHCLSIKQLISDLKF